MNQKNKISYRIFQLAQSQDKINHDSIKANAYDVFLRLYHNRLMFWFSDNYKDYYSDSPTIHKLMKDISFHGNQLLKKKRETLNLIREIGDKNSIEYILPKTFKLIPYINSDLDLLVKPQDYNKWVKLLCDSNFVDMGHKVFLVNQVNQSNLVHKNLYKIDITTQFNWQEKQYFDTNYLWDQYNINNHMMNSQTDFGVIFTSIIYKKVNYCIIDYLYLLEYLKSGNPMNLIHKQASKHNWANAFDRSLNMLKDINPKKDIFPYYFPLKDFIGIHKEMLDNKSLSINYMSYITLANIRYRIYAKKKHLPFHVYWYPYNKLDALKDLEITL